MAGFVDGFDADDELVDGSVFEGEGVGVAGPVFFFPVGGGGGADDNDEAGEVGLGVGVVPAHDGVVASAAGEADAVCASAPGAAGAAAACGCFAGGLAGGPGGAASTGAATGCGRGHGDGRFGSESQGGGRGGVDADDARGISGGSLGEGVVDRVLVGEVFGGGGDADGAEAFLVKGGVIAAAAEAVVAEDHVGEEIGGVFLRSGADEAGELARRGIAGIFGEDQDAVAILDAVAAGVVADDVVVEDGFDFLVAIAEALGHGLGAHEALLFAGEGNENEGGVEIILGEDAGAFHDAGGAAAIVAGAGGWGFGSLGGGAAGGGADVHGVVMAGDHDPAILGLLGFAREEGDDVAQFSILIDAAAAGDGVGVETDLELGAVGFELVEDPLASDADAAVFLGRVGEGIAGFEGLEFLDDGGDALFGDVLDNFLNHGVGRGGGAES